MLVNGSPYDCRPGLTLLALFAELKIDSSRVAVMHGDRWYKRNAIPDAPLEADDVIEVVTMMQGG